jgi:hypothetical protein
MSYDVFRLNQAAVAAKKFELVICDEAHRLKAKVAAGGRMGTAGEAAWVVGRGAGSELVDGECCSGIYHL